MSKVRKRIREVEVSPDGDTVEVPAIVAENVPPIDAAPGVLFGANAGYRRRAVRIYIYLPLIFLTVALLGGLRLDGTDGSFIFLKPALVCLIFAAMLLLLFFRSGLLLLQGWFNDGVPVRETLANGAVLLSLYAAATQIFNSLIPEQGLPFWIVSFCFFWVLWNNLFAGFDTKRLLRSLGALFGLAFVARYVLLANLAATGGQSWIRTLIEDPARGAATWLLDLPRFSPATGYIQFLALMLFLLGLYLLPATSRSEK